MRKSGLWVIALLMAMIMLPGLAVTAYANSEPEEIKSNALFLQSVTASKVEETYQFDFIFGVSTASAAGSVDAGADLFSFNGTALPDIEGATLTYYLSKANFYSIRAVLPADAVNGDGSDEVRIASGFESETAYVTTVQYYYLFNAFSGNGPWSGAREYRSDNMDDFEGVSVKSLSVPNVQSGNLSFSIYFSDAITPKKLIDMQVRHASTLKGYHGDTGTSTYTNEMIDMYSRYGLLFSNNPESLLYKLWFGTEKYNGLEAFPYNNSGSPYDMTPQAKVEGLDLYNIMQIQEQTADSTLYYKDKQSGSVVLNSGSVQPLVIQIHMDSNFIQVVFKGDSGRDSLATEWYDNTRAVTIDRTSFNENIAPARNEKMAVQLKAGMLFPNGRMLKEDVSFYYLPEKGSWYLAGTKTVTPEPDLTLTNQEGYTDAELAALQSGGGGNGGTADNGCGSSVAGSAIMLVLMFGFCGALICACRKSSKVR